MIEARSRSMRASAVVVIGFLIAGLGVTSASATTKTHGTETCVPVEGVPYQPAAPAVQAVTCPDPAPPIVTEWVTWDTGSWAPLAQNANDVSWPQSLVGVGQIAPTTCETTYQQDKYVGTREQIDAVVGDGILTNIGQPEDSEIVMSWLFASSDACPPPTLTPVTPRVLRTDPCGPNNATVVGVQEDGIVWTTGEDPNTIVAQAARTYTLGDATATFSAQDSGVACPIEVTPIKASVVDPPICGADNDVLNIPTTTGVDYADTGWVDGERTITATAQTGYTLVGTTSWTFYDEGAPCPIEVTAVKATVTDPPMCGPDNDVLNIPTTVGVDYSDTGWVDGERTIAATAQEGYTLVGTSSWTFYDEAADCPIVLNQTELAPTVVPICMPNNDKVTIPKVEGVTYTDTGWVNGKRTITAVAGEGYALVGTSTWTFTDVPSGGCPTGVIGFAADEVPGANLAFTGVPSTNNGLLGLALLLLISGTALVVHKVRED